MIEAVGLTVEEVATYAASILLYSRGADVLQGRELELRYGQEERVGPWVVNDSFGIRHYLVKDILSLHGADGQ